MACQYVGPVCVATGRLPLVLQYKVLLRKIEAGTVQRRSAGVSTVKHVDTVGHGTLTAIDEIQCSTVSLCIVTDLDDPAGFKRCVRSVANNGATIRRGIVTTASGECVEFRQVQSVWFGRRGSSCNAGQQTTGDQKIG